MKLFVTAKFKREENKAEIEKLCKIVRSAGFDDSCFVRDVERYQRGVSVDSRGLMTWADK